MTLQPTYLERLARARTDLRMGLPVLIDASGGWMVAAAAETLGAERLQAMRELGAPVLALTDWRAATLKARAYDGDLARIPLPTDAGPDWIQCAADPAQDLQNPLRGPFHTLRDGSAAPHRAALLLVKSARLLPAAVLVPVTGDLPQELTRIAAADIATWQARPPVERAVVSGRVPLAVSEAGRVHVFRPDDGGEEHYAVEIGSPDRNAPVLTRLHSACFTGDILGSLKCDCGPQLKAALKAMADEGNGILLYLNQEGRGIGLANKMRAYSLQDQGFDTVEANHRLGFEDDERDFRVGAAILKSMGFSEARLMTNNPAKMAMLNANGIAVTERVPLKVGLNPLNEKYMDVKAKKSGHIL